MLLASNPKLRLNVNVGGEKSAGVFSYIYIKQYQKVIKIIMKKILIPFVAFAAFLMVSCSNNSGEKAISLSEEAVAKIEEAKSAEEIKKIYDETEAKIDELYEGKDLTDTEKDKIEKAWDDFAAAYEKKAVEFNPGDKAISLIKDYTIKMEKAESVEEIEKLGEEMEKEFSALAEGNEDFVPTEAQEKELGEAMQAFQEAAMKKAAELAGAAAE